MTTTAHLSMDSIVCASRQQVSSELGGEVVILNVKAGIYHGLDNVGATVWQLIQHPQKVAAIRDCLLKEYQVEADRCEQDLLELLQDMAANGLIEVRRESAA